MNPFKQLPQKILPDCAYKRELLAEFEKSLARTHESEKLAREALNRERAKLN